MEGWLGLRCDSEVEHFGCRACLISSTERKRQREKEGRKGRREGETEGEERENSNSTQELDNLFLLETSVLALDPWKLLLIRSVSTP